jgi:CheY-like chemotaxis protein
MARYILVVDDDRDIRDTLVELLTEHGFPALGAGNGAEALEVLRTTAPPPALILLDLMMPVMDGREFRDRQLENPAWAEIPVIVVSAYNDVDRQAAALGLDHLRKPLAVRPLLDAIRRHVARG